MVSDMENSIMTSSVNDSWNELWEHYPKQYKTLANLQDVLEYPFQRIELLFEALTHRSALVQFRHGLSSKKEPSSLQWNERIEFLGDSVLGLAISSFLWTKNEQLSEGHLSKIRSFLVNETSLAAIARGIQLQHSIIIGYGEEKAGGRNRDGLLADALEAVIGAVYLDGGFEQAKKLVHLLFEEKLKNPSIERSSDSKSQLQEWAQEKHRSTPVYLLLSEQGPDHAKEFEVGVYLGEKELAKGRGLSKKRASQAAAEHALQAISL